MSTRSCFNSAVLWLGRSVLARLGLFARGPQLGSQVSRYGWLALAVLRRAEGRLELGSRHRLVDVGAEHRLPGQNRHPVVGHGQEPVADSRPDPAVGRGVLRQYAHHAAWLEDTEHRRVTGQNAYIAVEGLGDHPVSGARPHLALGDDQLDLQA